MRMFRLVSVLMLIAALVVAVQAKAQARATGSICDNENCFCGGNSCECDLYQDCSLDFPDFCTIANAVDCPYPGLTYCEGGSTSTPCMAIWAYGCDTAHQVCEPLQY